MNQSETSILEPSEGGERPKKIGRNRKSLPIPKGARSPYAPQKPPGRSDPPSEALSIREPSVPLMLQEILRGGITTDNVAAVEKMIGLYERMQDRKAEQDFAVAFNALMSEIPSIQATKPVPSNDGTVRYRYAPLEEIDAQLRPLALKHGFTYSFREGKSDDGRITKICEVQHVNGHKRSNQFTVRVSAPPNTNASQADGSTHSYAKRGALCDAFGIIVAHMDDDARGIGKPIGTALAQDLMDRVRACGANEVAFLKFAGVTVEEGLLPVIEDYEKIGLNRFDALDEILKKKEGRRV